MSKPELDKAVSDCIATHRQEALSALDGFFSDRLQLWNAIAVSLRSKIGRLPKLEQDNDVRFGENLMESHIETAVRAGFYTYCRDSHAPKTKAEIIANFYFIREFCYGSMFRFNKDGKFNIPYGGIAYNKKDFRAKARRLFSPKTRQLLSGAKITSLDFRSFFEKHWGDLTRETFCFLDPPYDTDFSEYDKMSFTMEDQKDLADIVARLPCQAMLIIKDTEFIRELYRAAQRKNASVSIARYDKTYTYNTRGRNKRETQHLLICNYGLTAPALFPELAAIERV